MCGCAVTRKKKSELQQRWFAQCSKITCIKQTNKQKNKFEFSVYLLFKPTSSLLLLAIQFQLALGLIWFGLKGAEWYLQNCWILSSRSTFDVSRNMTAMALTLSYGGNCDNP